MFSESERKRIEEAVEHAERLTSGEIVPFVVEHSDPYDDAAWKGGLLSAFLAVSGLLAVDRLSGWWWSPGLAAVAITVVGGSVVGMLMSYFITPLRRFLAGRAVLDRRVAQRAAEAFVTEGVFRTRERTGILIFVSVFEREVLVVGDSGISANVKQDEWDEIVRAVVTGIRSGKLVDGLVRGIGMSAELLRKHGFVPGASDRNELPNTVRTED